MKYIYQLKKWPDFKWDKEKLSKLLTEVHHRQGRLLGRMEGLGFHLRAEATLETLTLDVLKSSEPGGPPSDNTWRLTLCIIPPPI
jgi:Fic family protein